MIDPFTYWSRIVSSLDVIGATGRRAADTVQAAHEVIASRTGMMSDAARSPFTVDHAELARMVPEKVAAFSASGNAVMQAWWTMQADYMAQAQKMSLMMMRGGPSTPAEFTDLWTRPGVNALHALEAGSRLGRDALAPVHKAATANARRLSKRAKSARS
jgi:hypothetical protein